MKFYPKVYQTIILVGLSVGIVGCKHHLVGQAQLEVEEQSAPVEAVETEVNQPENDYVEGKGFRYQWPLKESRLISAPADIRQEANARCMSQKFERSYIHHLEFDEHTVTGFFACASGGK